MQHITTGRRVELAYEILAGRPGESKQSVFTFTEAHPDSFIMGYEPGMLKAFEQNLMGLGQGESFDFTLSPQEAFGERNPDMEVELGREVFTVDGEFDDETVFVGAYVPMNTADGHRIEGRVLRITDTKVTLDFNHQMAGMSMRYRGIVQSVTDVDPAELEQQHHCCGHCGHGGGEGEGCGHHHEGDACGCDGCDGCGK